MNKQIDEYAEDAIKRIEDMTGDKFHPLTRPFVVQIVWSAICRGYALGFDRAAEIATGGEAWKQEA